MDVLDTILLGAVQGLAEFLPVSSSAHLSFAQQLLKVGGGGPFIILLHIPSLLCIACFYPKELLQLLTSHRRELLLIVVATIPGAACGYLLKDMIDSALANNFLAGIGLVFTGLTLFLAHFFGGGKRTMVSLGAGSALLIGLVQVGALMPGVSRLGMCLTACLLLRLESFDAVRFSVFLSIPMTLGAAFVKRGQIVQLFAETRPIFIVAAAGAVFVLGICALRLLHRLCEKRSLWIVACYCLMAGTVAIFLGG